MHVSSLMEKQYTDIENRKRALRHKTADETYRRNAQYHKPRPSIETLLNLLTGKTDQEHNEEYTASARNQKGKDIGKNSIWRIHNDPVTQITNTSLKESTFEQAPSKQHIREKAISRYTFQTSMARQGFQFAEPTIYMFI
ncbi:hypothetical protein M3603_00485 [Rummeliibacillus stabekisii]|uniref:hypothetical protein n=1 Tax=Rummeliibacillus stabekisii TaxID=241244 RepID=UPI00203C3738|nr:hypothetical protein [Rummeliibacillus stabekisii]MCM3315133.1 hypothetical protein [Rummeliibacillus stabekisii]